MTCMFFRKSVAFPLLGIAILVGGFISFVDTDVFYSSGVARQSLTDQDTYFLSSESDEFAGVVWTYE